METGVSPTASLLNERLEDGSLVGILHEKDSGFHVFFSMMDGRGENTPLQSFQGTLGVDARDPHQSIDILREFRVIFQPFLGFALPIELAFARFTAGPR